MPGFYLKCKKVNTQEGQFEKKKKDEQETLAEGGHVSYARLNLALSEILLFDVCLSLFVSLFHHRAETERGLSRKHIIEGEVHTFAF